MSQAAQRAAIKAAVDTVANAGTVHDYRRYVATASEADTAFKVTEGPSSLIRFADLDWSSAQLTPDAWEASGLYRMIGPSRWTIRLYRSIDDSAASGAEFGQTLEDVMHAVSMAAATYTPARQDRVPVVLESNDHRGFGFPGVGIVSVHYGQISVLLPDSVVY